ncbi:MAG TPA: DUF6600 domain-containing protein [Steroidobacteraceae bacterium]|nr:DUF6600 domain-containing protein [Steroidobacteraceae bacterium]
MSRRPRSILGAIAVGILISLGLAGAAVAQSADPADPPGRAAQLSYAEGSVSLEPAGTSSWTSAVINRPLTVGDKLWADQDSRAELDIGDAVIRLGSTTGFSFLNLDDHTAQMQVTAGAVIVHVFTLSNGENDEIDTPNLALTLQQPGIYRVEVSESGDATRVEVDEGEALATGGGQSYPVAAQQSVTFTGSNTLAADYATLGAPDAFDQWSMDRDRQLQQQAAVAQEYVPPDTVGADDLGSYGTWQETPDWGYAWFPTVGAGWAPYSLGSWVWVAPWGWTWVDAEPWGFAPFHYGRWGYWNHRWCWVPGPRRVHPIYSPALVAWVGGRYGDRRTAVSATTGAHVGWFALGPRDVYVPGYHASARYVRDINTTNARLANTTQIASAYQGSRGNPRYENSEVPGAITAVPRNVFTSARPVGPNRIALPHQSAVNLRASTAAPAITPVRESVLGAGAGRMVRTPPRAVMDRPVVARLAPPRAPASFASEQAAIRANGGRPLSMTQLSRMRPNTPAAAVRLAPESRGVPAVRLMSGREHALQQPSLPPAHAASNDRPPWAQARPMVPRAPMEHAPAARFAPPQQNIAPQRQMPRERFAPQQPPPEERFAAPQRQVPQQRFVPQRPIPEQRFSPPQRQVPEQRFTPPERQMPEQRFTPPAREIPQQRFTPPERSMPEQHFSAPRYSPPQEAAPPAPRAAPARPPEPRSEGRRPPR